MGRGKKWYRKKRTQRTYMYNPWAKEGNAGGWGECRAEGGLRGGGIGNPVIA